jgi:hypothetical protein
VKTVIKRQTYSKITEVFGTAEWFSPYSSFRPAYCVIPVPRNSISRRNDPKQRNTKLEKKIGWEEHGEDGDLCHNRQSISCTNQTFHIFPLRIIFSLPILRTNISFTF